MTRESKITPVGAGHIRLSLLWKISITTLIAGLIPLLILSVTALNGYNSASDQATDVAANALDTKSAQSLQLRAIESAQSLSRFLDELVRDTKTFTLLARTPENYVAFYQASQSEIWYRTGSANAPQDRRQAIPLYREIAYIGADGRERIRIVDGKAVPDSELRDVSAPSKTTYRTENYFNDTRALKQGDVYVSHMTAWHTSLPNVQPGGIAVSGETDGAAYARYEATIRFASAVYNAKGEFDGIIVLSLDHRHIMEFSQHILPDAEQPATPYPDYRTGNYAYIFDDEGYTISHPLLSRIRGLSAEGQLISPIVSGMSDEERKKHPFNLNFSDALNQETYKDVMAKKSDIKIITNIGGTPRATIYAPISFSYGVYRDKGIFGGIVIGTSTKDFHKAADKVGSIIESQSQSVQNSMYIVAIAAIIILVLTAALVTSTITRPLVRLSRVVQKMEDGELDSENLNIILNQRVEDEVTKLAQVFKKMAVQVQLRETKLKRQIEELNIQIDEQKKAKQVAEITETDYFQNLRSNALGMRNRFKGRDST